VHAILLMLLLAKGALLPTGLYAPPIEARGSDGRPVGQDFEGTITIVDFFATWCPRCREALPDYQRLKVTFGDRVRLVIVDVEEDPATVRAFFARRSLPQGAELALDRSGATARAWRVTGYPTMYLLDRRGVVRHASSGWGGDSLRHLSEVIPFLENEEARRQAQAGAPRGKRGRRPVADRAKSALADPDERARAMGVEILH
jgi:thiol-disulfide isomerase/thioredoxin